MKNILKISSLIVFLILIISLSVYLLPFKRKYVTQFGCKIYIPLFSKIEETESNYATLDEQAKIIINSYQSKNSWRVINNFIKNFKFYKDEYREYYYNELDDYTIIIESIEKKDKPRIELTVIKGNYYYKYYNEDEVYFDKFRLSHLGNVFLESGNNGLLKISNNIYTYNLSRFWISYVPDGYNRNFHFTIEDTFKYNYHTIDEFLDYYEKLVEIHYGKKIEEGNYVLYSPEEARIHGRMDYSILVCNGKYIFGDKNLEYNENLCNTSL